MTQAIDYSTLKFMCGEPEETKVILITYCLCVRILTWSLPNKKYVISTLPEH